MGKPKKETVRKLRGLMILDQMEDYTPLHKLHNLSNELIETVSKPKKKGSYIPPDPKPGGYNLCL
jgi:hypothetical protein